VLVKAPLGRTKRVRLTWEPPFKVPRETNCVWARE
jgi:hypothetical protein